jgi:hypothetical protein
MTTLENKLASLKAQVANFENELSNEVKAKKIALSDELYRLLDNEKYNGAINIAYSNILVEGEYYDKYAEIYVENFRRPVENVYASDSGDSYVEDEYGEVFYFLDHLTLFEVEDILSAVKKTIEDDQTIL